MLSKVKWPKITRNLVLLSVGLAMAVNEAFVRAGEPRGEIIILASGMMGLPAFLGGDEKKQEDKK